MIDTALLHSRIASSALDFLRELFGEEVKPAGTDKWRVGRHGSLAITLKDGRLVFYSHEDGTGGDAVGLWQRVRGGSVGEVLRALAAWAGVADEAGKRGRCGDTERGRGSGDGAGAGLPSSQSPCLPVTPSGSAGKVDSAKVPAATTQMLTVEQLHEAAGLARRLAGDEGLMERIARRRGWKVETVRELARQEALGWSDGWPGHHQGSLVFCYASGIKHRWRKPDGDRGFGWTCGGQASLWREWTVREETRTVLLFEGETDAISMLDGGVEASAEISVLALPCAGVAPPSVLEIARGRYVELYLDRDEAGHKATQKIGALIKPVTLDLRVWRPI